MAREHIDGRLLQEQVRKSGPVLKDGDLVDLLREDQQVLSGSAVEDLAASGVRLSLEDWTIEALRANPLPAKWSLVNCRFPVIDLVDVDAPGIVLDRARADSTSFLHCDLTGAQLNYAVLPDSVFIDCELTKAQFQGSDLTRADFQNANLEGANLSGAQLDGVDFSKANLYRTRIDRRSLGTGIRQEKDRDFLEACAVYLNLKNNFLSLGAYDDASWAYVQERTMERYCYAPRYCVAIYEPELRSSQLRLRERVHRVWNRITRRRRRAYARDVPEWLDRALDAAATGWFRVRYFSRFLSSALIGAPWGYGERVINSLVIAVAVVFAVRLALLRCRRRRLWPDRSFIHRCPAVQRGILCHHRLCRPGGAQHLGEDAVRCGIASGAGDVCRVCQYARSPDRGSLDAGGNCWRNTWLCILRSRSDPLTRAYARSR